MADGYPVELAGRLCQACFAEWELIPNGFSVTWRLEGKTVTVSAYPFNVWHEGPGKLREP